MPEQLFLFEHIPETNGEIDLPVTGNMAGELEKSLTAKEKNSEHAENPFSDVQQKQQEKIDMLLLTPNKKRGRKSFKDMDEESILPEIPDDEVLFQKQYYPTKTVAEWFGITQSQLRVWETEFEVLKPKKNGKGDRFFRPEDVKMLKLIYHLIRRRKFTVQGAKQYLKEHKKDIHATTQLVESLNKLKQFLLELKAISG